MSGSMSCGMSPATPLRFTSLCQIASSAGSCVQHTSPTALRAACGAILLCDLNRMAALCSSLPSRPGLGPCSRRSAEPVCKFKEQLNSVFATNRCQGLLKIALRCDGAKGPSRRTGKGPLLAQPAAAMAQSNRTTVAMFNSKGALSRTLFLEKGEHSG